MSGRLFAVLFISVGVVAIFAGFPFMQKAADPNVIDRVGLIEATEVYLSAKINERISALPYAEGDFVEAGATVVWLSTTEIKAEIAQAETNVKRGAAEVVMAKAVLTKEEARWAETKRSLDRITKLHREGLVATVALDEAATAHDLAKAEVAVAKARIQSTEAELEQYRAHLMLFDVRLKEREIHAPISGIVSLKAYETGEMVSPGTTIVTLIDPQSIWARIDLEEGEVGKIRLGSKADVFLDSVQTTPFPGKITEMGATGAFATQRDTKRGKQDIQTFRVKIGVASHQGRLKPGMTVRARIYIEDVDPLAQPSKHEKWP